MNDPNDMKMSKINTILRYLGDQISKKNKELQKQNRWSEQEEFDKVSMMFKLVFLDMAEIDKIFDKVTGNY